MLNSTEQQVHLVTNFYIRTYTRHWLFKSFLLSKSHNHAQYTQCSAHSYVTDWRIMEHQKQQNSNITYTLELTALENISKNIPESSRFQCIHVCYTWTWLFLVFHSILCWCPCADNSHKIYIYIYKECKQVIKKGFIQNRVIRTATMKHRHKPLTSKAMHLHP